MIKRLCLLVLVVVLLVPSFAFNFFRKVQTAHHMQSYVKNNKYEPFDLSRESWGVGTVISFSRGRENIEWFNNECLNLSAYTENTGFGEIRETEISLAQSSYAIGSKASFEVNLSRAITKGVDLKGAFNDERVSAVKISINSPVERAVSKGALNLKIKELVESNNDCVQKIIEPGIFVIDRVLELGGFSYTFLSKSKSILSIDANILKAIGLNPEVQAGFVGKSKLTSDETRFVGYRLFRYKVKGGIAESKIIEERVSPDEIGQLKRKNSNSGKIPPCAIHQILSQMK